MWLMTGTCFIYGEPWAMTALAKELLQAKWSLAGPKYFKYKGEWLNDIRHRCKE